MITKHLDTWQQFLGCYLSPDGDCNIYLPAQNGGINNICIVESQSKAVLF